MVSDDDRFIWCLFAVQWCMAICAFFVVGIFARFQETFIQKNKFPYPILNLYRKNFGYLFFVFRIVFVAIIEAIAISIAIFGLEAVQSEKGAVSIFVLSLAAICIHIVIFHWSLQRDRHIVKDFILPGLDARLKALQFFVAAMISGPVIFLSIVLFISKTSTSPVLSVAGLPFCTTIGVVMAVLVVVLTRIVLKRIQASTIRQLALAPVSATSSDKKKIETEKLLALFQKQTMFNIVALESPAIFMINIYLIERHPLALIISGVLMAGMILHFPTRARLETWIAVKLKLIEQARQQV